MYPLAGTASIFLFYHDHFTRISLRAPATTMGVFAPRESDCATISHRKGGLQRVAYIWTPLFGAWELLDEAADSGVFHGREVPYVDAKNVEHKDGYANGVALCNAGFAGGGTISVSVRFASLEIAPATSGGIIFWAGPNAASYLVCGFNLGSSYLYAIRGWTGSSWVDYDAKAGDAQNLQANHEYGLILSVAGSTARLQVDGIQILSAEIPFRMPPGPVGINAFAKHDVFFSNFRVQSRRAKAFVVMQFSTPFNELHEQVIKPICNEFKIDAERADDVFGPGVIVQDIVTQMLGCDVVIAEITPANPNVYYEVGYAHALKKPCILIATRGTTLPFDLSPFRVLMYENSIDGKQKVEQGLRRHLQAIQSEISRPL